MTANPEQVRATESLKMADNLLARARYSLNRQDLNKWGNEWVFAPDVQAALVSINLAIELLEETKAELSSQ